MTAPSLNTPDRAIRLGLKDAGLLQEGADPTSEQYAECIGRLNDIINIAMITNGLRLWTLVDESVTLTAGTSSYNIYPGGDVSITKPAKVVDGYYLDTNNIRRPLFPISWSDWVRLSNVTQQGAITQYFVDKQQTMFVVHFWLVPDATAATGTAHLVLQQQITNFTGITDTLNFPQEWFMYLRWALADDVCTGQPQTIMDRCQMRASMYFKILSDWDVEDGPVYFQCDSRMGVSGRFV
jgi:hypothetical protein